MTDRDRLDPVFGDIDFQKLEFDEPGLHEAEINSERNKQRSGWGFWKTLLLGYLTTWISVVLFILSYFISTIAVGFNIIFPGLFGGEVGEIISLSIGPLIFLLSISLILVVVSKYRGSTVAKMGMFVVIISLWALSIGTSFWLILGEINSPFQTSEK